MAETSSKREGLVVVSHKEVEERLGQNYNFSLPGHKT